MDQNAEKKQPAAEEEQVTPPEETTCDEKKAKKEKGDKKSRTEKELAQKIETLEKELAAQREQDMRIRAEYDNYRKRTAREQEAIGAKAKADTVRELLPIADAIAMAVAVREGEDQDIRKGVQMVQNQIHTIFSRMGVEEFGKPGDAFDPELHNAVMHVEDDAFGENEIAEVLQPGYRIGDRILRHAIVKAAN